MRLNTNKIKEQIAIKWHGGCPMCGSRNFGVDPTMQVFLPVDQSGNIQVIAGEKFPVALIKCLDCGLVLTMSPVIVGAVDR